MAEDLNLLVSEERIRDIKEEISHLLELLKERGSEGVFVYEFMMPRNRGGLGVAQYNARIYGLRKKGYIIENKEPGHFVLKEGFEPEQRSFA